MLSINALIEPLSFSNYNSFNTIVKCSFTSSIRHTTRNNKSIGLGSFLLTRLGTKTRTRNRQINSTRRDLDKQLGTRTELHILTAWC